MLITACDGLDRIRRIGIRVEDQLAKRFSGGESPARLRSPIRRSLAESSIELMVADPW